MSIIRKEQLTNPLSASYALTASYALNASTSTIDTGSFVTTSSFNAFTSSVNTFTASYNTGSFSGSFTGSFNGTASWAEYVVNGGNIDTSTFATTGSNTFVGDQIINGENLGFIVDASNLKRVGFMKYGGFEGSIARVADQNFRILRTTGSNINDGTNAITDFYIAGDGKVGIGTTTPAYTLDVSGSSNFIGDQTISGSIYLGSGSIISESGSNTIITPPGAQIGQSLVIRPTSGDLTITSSGFIVAGVTLTITLNSSQYSAASLESFYYELSGSTAQQLGLGSLIGQFNQVNWVDSGGNTGYNQITIPIPINSTAAILKMTITGSSGNFGGYVFTNNPFTVTNNGIINNEVNHIHLISGDPSTVDLYLGDDDQYVKIEKNAGNVVIGTNLNTNQWVFNTSGSLTVPGNISGALNLATTGSNNFNGNQTIIGSLSQGLEGNIAPGPGSHAEGSATSASGEYSHAEGDFTQAIGNYSHAEGQDTMTLASAQYSHAEGNNTIAAANHQHVQGQWNVTSSIPAAFIVGNGTDNGNRSNLIYAHDSTVEITGSLSTTEFFTTTINETSLENFSSTSNYAGTVLRRVSIDGNVVPYDLVYLENDGTWYQNDQSASSSGKKLGIYLDNLLVLIEGHIVVGVDFTVQAAEIGAPIFIRENGGIAMSCNSPTTGYVRILGHIYYQNQSDNSLYIMRFNPSNDFYLLG
jgi:hypothetical protein